LNAISPPSKLPGMASKPEPPKLPSFNVYKLAAKAVWVCTIEAAKECEAIEKVANERNLPANRLIAHKQTTPGAGGREIRRPFLRRSF
jgi:hypothetical protein